MRWTIATVRRVVKGDLAIQWNGTNLSLVRCEKYNPGRRRCADRVRAAMMDTFSRALPR